MSSEVVNLLKAATRLAQHGKFEEASERFLEVVEMANEDPRGWFGLGVCLARSGNLEDARQAIEEARRLGHPKAQAVLDKMARRPSKAAEKEGAPAAAKAVPKTAAPPQADLKKATPKPKAIEPVDPSKKIDLGKRVRIMLIEDKPEDRDAILQVLYAFIKNVEIVETPFAESASRTIVGMGIFDIAIMDWQTSPGDAKNLLDFLKMKQPHIPVIVLTQTWSEEMATEAIQAGADYCMVKASGFAKILPYVIEQRFKQSFALQEKIEGDIVDSYQDARRKYFDAMSQLVVVLDQDGKVTDVNEATLELLHSTRDGLIGQQCEKLFRNAEELEDFFPIHDVFESDQQVMVERFDPTLRRHFRLTGVPVHEEDRVEFLVVLEDITQQKSEAADPMRGLGPAFSGLEEGLFYKDAEGKFIYANAAYARLLGAEAADLAGRTEKEAADSERAQKHQENEEAALAGGKTVTHEELVDGRWLAHEVSPVRGESGQALGVVGIARDVTDIKGGAAGAGAADLAKLADLAGEVAFELDANGKVTSVNAAVSHLTGHDRDELEGKSFAAAMLPVEAREDWQALLDRIVQGGESVSRRELLVRKADGGTLFGEVSLTPVVGKRSATVTGVRGILRDASVEKRLERAIQVLKGEVDLA